MRCRSNLPSACHVQFGSAIAEHFGVAGGNKRSGGAPHFGRAEQLAVGECFRPPKADEHKAQVVAAVSPYFFKTAKGQAGLFIKAIRGPNCQVCYCVALAVRFAKNVRMAMAFERLSICANPGEDTGRTIAFVGPLTQCVMDSVGNGNSLSESRRNSADHCCSVRRSGLFLPE